MSKKATETSKILKPRRENSQSRRQKNDFPSSITSSVDDVLFFQSTIGNRALGRLLKSKSSTLISHNSPRLTSICSFVKQNEGHSLDPATYASMESRFGYDFSEVRVHTGKKAEELTADLGAQAFTIGNDIVFGEKKYNPGRKEGKKLISHELAHVLQQRHGIGGSKVALERQAELSEGATRGLFGPTPLLGANTPSLGVQLKPDQITAINVNLSTSTVSMELDDGSALTGVIKRTNLVPGNYQAQWSQAKGNLIISPWPTTEEVIYFEITGTHHFIRRVAKLRNQITKRIPFKVISAPAWPKAPRAEKEESEDVVSLTPEEAIRRCEANDLPGIKVFPFRGTRFGAAPIYAGREGDFIVVEQPVYVRWNEDFRKQTRTLPLETFISGVRLDPNEIVRVHVYEPRWYHLNITGSTEGDIEHEFCVTGEQMLEIGKASTRATLFNIALTGVEAATFLIPIGKLAQPLARPLVGGVRNVTAAAMIGLAEATPGVARAASTRAAVVIVEGQTLKQAAGITFRQTVAHTVVPTAGQVAVQTAPKATTAAVRSVVAPSIASVGGIAGIQAGVEAAGTLTRPVVHGAEEITLSQAEYQAALSQVFPSQYFSQITRTVDGIGRRAAQRAVSDPRFLQAVQNGNWSLAGTLFHSAAAQEARLLSASRLPAGWSIHAERVIQAGAGGSRADILLRGPAGQIIEFDWKTTGRSALSSASRQEMARHAGQITTNIGGTLTTQESRSWIDFVRALLPGINWPR